MSLSSTRVLAACAALVACAMSAVGNPALADRPVDSGAGCGTEWQIVPSPNLGTKPSILRGVGAVSSTDAWAVGVAGGVGSGLPFRPLIEHWDGSAWTVVPAAHQPRGSAELWAVAAVSSDDVWTVGDWTGRHPLKSPQRTLVEHWDGRTWSIVKSLDIGPGSNEFTAVAATSSTDVWAAGAAFGPAQRRYKPLAEHWNGSSWTVYEPPSSPSGDNSINGMTEVSNGDVWAVGEAGKSGERRPLAEHWDGTSWTRVPTGTPGDNFLLGASASSSSDVWAVGWRYTDAGSAVPLSEHWDGTAWSFVPTPHPSPYFDTLAGVVALSTTEAWAVGSNPIRPRNQQPLIERWDGAAWSIVPGPTGPMETNGLAAIDADPDGDLWAVGTSIDIGLEDGRTLIERRCPS